MGINLRTQQLTKGRVRLSLDIYVKKQLRNLVKKYFDIEL